MPPGTSGGDGAADPGAATGGAAPAPDLVEVGRIGKPHGLRGEVAVIFVSNRSERTRPGAVFVAGPGELRVVTARPVPGRPERFIVGFEGVVDRPGAERLRGTVLSAEPIDDPDALWVHELVGAAVVDGSGTVLGRVAALVANPGGDLLELEAGGLVPLAFVVARTSDRIEVDVPAGLLD